MILDLDLNIHTGGHVQPHQHINCLRIRIEYIDQAVVRTYFKMLVRVLVNKGRAANGKFFNPRWQGYRANNLSAAALCCFNYSLGRLIQYAMIISLQTNSNLLFCHVYLPIQ